MSCLYACIPSICLVCMYAYLAHIKWISMLMCTRCHGNIACSRRLFIAQLLPRVVSAFSKKTGDYGVLSSTDVKVLALAYEFECRLGVERGRNLRTAPLQQVMYVLTESLLLYQWEHTHTHHRCQPSYLAKWDRSTEKAGHWLKKAGQSFSLLAMLAILSNASDYTSVRNPPS